MIYNSRGQQSDRTTVSIIEDYIKGLPPGTWATPKMVMMNCGITNANHVAAFMLYLHTRGVVERKKNPEGHFIYTAGKGTTVRQFAKKAEYKGTRQTKTGVELKLAPPPPVEKRLWSLTLEQTHEALMAFLSEFGLEVWEVDGKLTLRNNK